MSLTEKITAWGGLLATMAVAVATIAHYWHRTPTPTIDRLGPYSVLAAPTGAELKVSKGIASSALVTLDNIACPAVSDPFGAQAAANLAAHAGVKTSASGKPAQPAQVWVEVVKEKQLIGRPDLIGEVFSESGENLNLIQLEAGLARAHIGAPKAYLAAEAAAKKAKRGLWAKYTTEETEVTAGGTLKLSGGTP